MKVLGKIAILYLIGVLSIFIWVIISDALKAESLFESYIANTLSGFIVILILCISVLIYKNKAKFKIQLGQKTSNKKRIKPNKLFVAFEMHPVLEKIATADMKTVCKTISDALSDIIEHSGILGLFLYPILIMLGIISIILELITTSCNISSPFGKPYSKYLYLKGDELCEQGKYNDAIKMYQKAHNLKADKDSNAYYHYVMTICYMKQANYTLMFRHHEKALEKCSFELRESLIDECIDKFIIEKDYDYKQVIDQFTFKSYHENLRDVTNNISNYLLAKQCHKDELYHDAIEFYSMIFDKKSIFYEKAQKAIEEIKQMPEKYYNTALEAFEIKSYDKSIVAIDNALKIASNKKYIELKSKIIEKRNERLSEELYQEAQKYYNQENYSLAVSKMKEAIQLVSNKAYKDFYNKAKTSLADVYYQEALKQYKNHYYTKATDLIKQAIDVFPTNQIYTNFLNEIKQKRADELYNQAIEYYNKDYNNARNFIKQAVDIIPNNKTYKNLLNDINNKIAEQEAYIKRKKELEEEAIQRKKTLQDAEDLYKKGLRKLKDGNFEGAIQDLKQAISLNPNYDYKQALEKAQEGKIDIETCSKKAILTLNGFDEEKAEQFMNDRKVMKWYDLESFAKHFNLQPAEYVHNEDKLIFPLKPQAKRGRAVDF